MKIFEFIIMSILIFLAMETGVWIGKQEAMNHSVNSGCVEDKP